MCDNEHEAAGGCVRAAAHADEPPFPPLISTEELAQLASGRGLTLREREVVLLLSRGAAYDLICRNLSISRPTLRTHIRGAYAKLGCRNRVELILALAHRVIDGVPRVLRRPRKRGLRPHPQG